MMNGNKFDLHGGKRKIQDDIPSILAFDLMIDNNSRTNAEGDFGFFENPDNRNIGAHNEMCADDGSSEQEDTSITTRPTPVNRPPRFYLYSLQSDFFSFGKTVRRTQYQQLSHI